ncbi:hypothetical protein Tco_1107249 [Tanacetum coccineum]
MTLSNLVISIMDTNDNHKCIYVGQAYTKRRSRKEEANCGKSNRLRRGVIGRFPICYEDEDDYTIVQSQAPVCDVPLCNNPTPLKAFKEHSETIIDSNDDSTSRCPGFLKPLVLTVFVLRSQELHNPQNHLERISKKRTKNEAKTTKPDTEWKSVEKTKSRQSPSVKKSTKVNPDKSKVKK